MDFEFDVEKYEDGDDDVLLTLQHDDGTNVTFLTANADAFTIKDALEPLITRIGIDQIYVAFNGDIIERLISESIEKNGEEYGKQATAFLPITKVLNIGLRAVNDYMQKNEGK